MSPPIHKINILVVCMRKSKSIGFVSTALNVSSAQLFKQKSIGKWTNTLFVSKHYSDSFLLIEFNLSVGIISKLKTVNKVKCLKTSKPATIDYLTRTYIIERTCLPEIVLPNTMKQHIAPDLTRIVIVFSGFFSF